MNGTQELASGTARFTERLDQLPPMPQAVARLLKLIDDPEATSHDLERVIETDPALVAALLRLVNSAMFNWPQQITTISHAIMLIGFLRLRSLALASVAAGLKHAVPAWAAEARDVLWEHAVTAALGAKICCERFHLTWSEEAFVAGLLHDCGRLAMLALEPREYAPLIRADHLPTCDEENAHFGTDHQQIGAALLQEWHLPERLVVVAFRHHDPEAYQGRHGNLIAMTVLGDGFFDRYRDVDPDPAFAALGLDRGALEEALPAIREQIRHLCTELLRM